ncbi:MAG: sugar transferase [Flavihumibacter sp.]
MKQVKIDCMDFSTTRSKNTYPVTNRNQYAHFTISDSATENKKPLHSEFFFVGKSNEALNALISTYPSGYAVDSVDKMTGLFQKLATAGKGIPELIVFGEEPTLEDLVKVKMLLKSNADFATIPLFLHFPFSENDTCSIQQDVIAIFDDVVDISTVGNKIHKRAALLKKVKKYQEKKSTSHSVLDFFQMDQLLKSNRIHPLKRLVDILASGLLLLLLSPIMLLIALAIRIESKGPIFYISKRAGRGYKVFDFLKFRTMVVEADKKVSELLKQNQYQTDNGKGPVFFKLKNDPRITRVGNFLRNTSLDELPQLINVLRGDMSLVGNRPLPLYEAVTLTTDEFAQRFLAPAGITGLWQVKKRGQGEMSVEERISLDIEYAHRHSFATDLWIMAKTPLALFQKENV